jgi:hypothetical protein
MERMREDPDTPRLDQVDQRRTCRGDRVMTIAVVMSSEDDHVRVLFGDVDAPKPGAVVALTENSAGVYDGLDVGVQVSCLERDATPQLLSGCDTIRFDGRLGTGPVRSFKSHYNWSDRYDASRKRYVTNYRSGKLPELQLKGFKFGKKQFSYSDTVIKAGKEALKEAAHAVLEAHSDSFDGLFSLVLKACAGHTMIVNGTAVRVEWKDSRGAARLWYVNGYKISQPDLEEVLRHSLCYPNSTKNYDAYLRSVSRMSLKYHKAVADGIDLLLSSRDFPPLSRKEGPAIRIPGGSDEDNGDVYRIKLRLNKTAGKKSTFDLLGRTRTITNFDMFVKTCGNATARGSSRDKGVLRVAEGVPHAALLMRLAALDIDLDSGGRFVPESMRSGVVMQTGGYVMTRDGVHQYDQSIQRPVEGVPDTPENRAVSEDLVRRLQEYAAEQMASRLTVLERSHALLQKVMKETGAVCEQENERWIYRVTGQSGNRYKVDEALASVHLDNPGDKAGGNHICIVKATTDISGYDYISSLLIALHKDRYTAHSIHTLQKIIDDKGA